MPATLGILLAMVVVVKNVWQAIDGWLLRRGVAIQTATNIEKLQLDKAMEDVGISQKVRDRVIHDPAYRQRVRDAINKSTG